MSKTALFRTTPPWQLAFLAVAGIVSSGYMSFRVSQPLAALFINPNPVPMAVVNLPEEKTGFVAGAEKVKEAADTSVSLTGQVARLAAQIASLERIVDGDMVLGDSDSNDVRVEFPPAVNLLRNSSFEEDSDGAPRQWQYQYDSTAGNTFTTAEAIRTGTRGLKFLGNTAGQTFGLSQPAAKTVERRPYAISIWVKPVNTDAHTVEIGFWDEVNNKMASSKSYNLSGTKEWSRLVYQIDNQNTWNGKKWFPMITVRGLTTGALYIEDAQLEEAGSYTPYHFEGGGSTQSHVSVLGDGSVEIDAHGNVYPAVTNIGSLGTSKNEFSSLRLSRADITTDGDFNMDGSLNVGGNSTFSGTATFQARIASNLLPDLDELYDLGSSTYEWRDLWIDRIGYIDEIRLLNNEGIQNTTDGDILFVEDDTTGTNTLTFDLNAGTNAIEIRNTEDLRLRVTGDNDLVLRAGDGAKDEAANNNDLQLAAEADLILDGATFTLATSDGNVTITADDSNAVLANVIIRSDAEATASTANGRDIFLAAVDDLILFGDNYSLTATNGVNYTVSNADVDWDLDDNDFVLRIGNGAAQSTADGQDLFISAEDDFKLYAALSTLETSSGDQTFRALGNADIILRAGDSAKDIRADNNDIQLAAEHTIYIDSSSLMLDTSDGGITIVADDSNAVLQDISIRSDAEAAGSTGNGGDIFMAAYDDMIFYMDNFSMVASNGANYAITGADMALEVNGNNDYTLRVGDAAAESTASSNDIFLAAEDAMILRSATYNLQTSGSTINMIALNSGITMSTGSSTQGTIELTAAGSLILDTSKNNTNMTIDAGTGTLNILNGATTLTTETGDVTISVGASNADTEDFVLRVSENATASTADGRDIFMSTVDDMILYMDNLSVTATNGVNYVVTAADYSVEINDDEDFIIRVGDGAAEVAANNNDIQLAAEADLILDGATFTLNTSNAAVGSLAINATRGGITMSTGSDATGNSEIVIKSAGSLVFDTSANNTNIAARSGTGLIDLTSARDNAQAILLSATAGGIDILASGASAGEDIDITATGSSVNVSSTEAVADALTLVSTLGGIDISTGSTGALTTDIDILSAGSVVMSAREAQADAISIRALNGGIDLSTGSDTAASRIDLLSGTGIILDANASAANGQIDLIAGGTLTLDTSTNNTDITIDSGTGDLTAQIGTGTVTAEDDVLAALALRASRGGIQVSSSNASGNGEIRVLSAGTLQLDTSGTNSNILARSGTGLIDLTSARDNAQAILLSATAGGIDILASGASAGEDIDITATGSSVNVSSTEAVADALTLVSTLGGIDISTGSTGALTTDIDILSAGSVVMSAREAQADAISIRALNGGIDLSTGSDTAASRIDLLSGTGIILDANASAANGQIDLIAGGTLTLDTSTNNTNILLQAGTGHIDISNNLNLTSGGYINFWDTVGSAGIGFRDNNGTMEFKNNAGAWAAMVAAATGGGWTDDGTIVRLGTGTDSVVIGDATGEASGSLEVVGDNDILLRAGAGARQNATSGNNDLQLAAEADLILDGATFTLNSSNGDVIINALATNADTEDFSLRVGDNATASTANGRDIFMAANDDMILYMDNLSVTATNGVNYVVTAADYSVEINDDEDFIIRVGDGAAEVAANNNDIQLAAEADVLVDGATFTLTSSNDATGTITLHATRGGITLSTSKDNDADNEDINITAADVLTLHGDTSTEIGKEDTTTVVMGMLCIRGSSEASNCPAQEDGRLYVGTMGGVSGDDPGDVYDVAEYYPASEAVDPGTVVVADSNARATVKMSRYPYQRVLGVVSSTPAVMIDQGWFGIGSSNQSARDALKPLVALVGRVPVKVTDENGSIRVGDRLVASSKPGYAMKAVKQGMTLGMALEDIDFAAAAEGKVMTFVNVSWYFPEVVQALEQEYAVADALGVEANAQSALADAVEASEADESAPAVLAAVDVAKAKVEVEIPPTEFPNIKVNKVLTVGEQLTVMGASRFEGKITVMADATFESSVIIVGNLRIGGNLEIAGAVTTSLTAGSDVNAGDPVAVNSDGTVSRASGGRPVAGIAATGAGAGGTVQVAVAGKVGGMSGLSAGTRYYVDASGSLTSASEGNQSVGVALSASQLLVQVAPGSVLPEVEEPAAEPAPAEEPVEEPAAEPAPPAEEPVVEPAPAEESAAEESTVKEVIEEPAPSPVKAEAPKETEVITE